MEQEVGVEQLLLVKMDQHQKVVMEVQEHQTLLQVQQ
jgi:hypothetical protein